MTVKPATVRVGDLVWYDRSWHRISDLQLAQGGFMTAVLAGMPGRWVLPSTFVVMRPTQV